MTLISLLGDAKDQISHLTDEISMKAYDNVAQQVGLSLYAIREAVQPERPLSTSIILVPMPFYDMNY
jgi:hypothetical protein